MISELEKKTQRRGSCILWTGAISRGYGIIYVNGKNVLVHRYVWEQENGPIPKGMVVDHKEHCDTRCINTDHLRLATITQNVRHRSGANKNNRSTGVRNVSEHGNGRYRVEIWCSRKRYRYGPFGSVEEAEIVARQKRAELFGEFSGKG